jgi:hypothetical protein
MEHYGLLLMLHWMKQLPQDMMLSVAHSLGAKPSLADSRYGARC